MALAPSRRPWSWRILRWIGIVVVVLVIANWPVTTRQGVNREVATHQLPLYIKAFQFLDRDAQFGQLSREVLTGQTTDEGRVRAAFGFVSRRLRPTPEGWPVVDDHILNIVIRGHGEPDQLADVYTLLLGYAGVPAFWGKVRAAGTADGVIFSFARVDGRWTVADVAQGVLFQNAAGRLATVDEVATDVSVRPEITNTLSVRATPYSRILDAMRLPAVPRTLRTDLQRPWPRLWYETKRAVGLEHDDGSER